MSLWGDRHAKCALCGWEYTGDRAPEQYGEHMDRHARLSEQFVERTAFTDQDRAFLRRMHIGLGNE